MLPAWSDYCLVLSDTGLSYTYLFCWLSLSFSERYTVCPLWFDVTNAHTHYIRTKLINITCTPTILHIVLQTLLCCLTLDVISNFINYVHNCRTEIANFILSPVGYIGKGCTTLYITLCIRKSSHTLAYLAHS